MLHPTIKRNLTADQMKNFFAILKKQMSEAEKAVTAKYESSLQNISYRLLSDEFKGVLPSAVYNAINQYAFKNYKNDVFEMQMGAKTMRTYKAGMPIPFTGGFEFTPAEDGEFIFEWIKMKFKTILGRDKSENRQIIDSLAKVRFFSTH